MPKHTKLGDAALPYSPNTASRGDAADGPSGSSAARMEFFISLLTEVVDGPRISAAAPSTSAA
jgi:hypothetical protein